MTALGNVQLDAESTYVPELLRRRLLDEGGAGLSDPGFSDAPAAVLLADVSGFTAFAESLARHGSEGVEQISGVLDMVLGGMVDQVEAHGGDVAKFAGDSLVAVFPAISDSASAEALAQAIGSAIRCGDAIQKGSRVDLGDIKLTVRVAIAAGSVRTAWLGGLAGRWEWVLVGEPISALAAVLRTAHPGEVLVTNHAWELIGSDAAGEALGGCHRLLSPPRGRDSALVRDPRPSPRGVQGFIPPTVLAAHAASSLDWLRELRRVTVVFVNLPELDHTTPLSVGQAIVAALQLTVARFEGTIDKLTVDDKGVIALAAFGLPPMAHEDDAVRGVRAALALRTELDDIGVKVAIGVASGRVYCGSVGGNRRREYTIIGDAVNLAARLMQSASTRGGLIVDPATVDAANGRIEFESLDAVTLKGKAIAVQLHKPIRERFAPRATQPLVGRIPERDMLRHRVELALAGTGGVVGLEGEAGIGKSSLVRDLMDFARAQGLPIIVGACDASERATPWFPWRAAVAALLDGDAAEMGFRERAERRLADPELRAGASVLSAVLPIAAREGDLVESMDASARASLLQRLIGELMRAKGPLLLVLEDVHWMDGASWDLLRSALRDCPALFVLLAFRPIEPPLPPVYTRLFVDGGSTQRVQKRTDVVLVRLQPLASDDVTELVAQRLGARSVPPQIAKVIRERAEGNALFAEELALALKDAGLIEVVDGQVHIVAKGGDLLDLSFGTSIEGAITARIDRLPTAEQVSLKTAAVIGRQFPVATLIGVHPSRIAAVTAELHLAAFQRQQLAYPEATDEHVWLFKHALVQQVAYNLLLPSQRRQLHTSIALWIEARAGADLLSQHGLLAWHWMRADEPARALEHLSAAAEQAFVEHASEEVIGFVDQALALAKQLPVDPARIGHWEYLAGESLFALGRDADAKERLGRSLEANGHRVPVGGASAFASVVVELLRQLWFRWVGVSAKAPEAARPVRREVARSWERLTELHYMSGATVPAFQAMLRSVNIAETVGPCPELVRGYSNFSLGASVTGNPYFGEIYLGLARKTDAMVNEPASRGWMHTSTPNHVWAHGRWDEAEAMIDDAVAYFRRVTAWGRWANVQLQRGNCALQRGQHQLAGEFFGEITRFARRVENPLYLALAWGGEAAVGLRSGTAADMLSVQLEQGLALFTPQMDRTPQLYLLGLLAVARWRAGAAVEALVALEGALDIVRRTDPLGSYLIEGYASAAEVAIAAWVGSPQDPIAQKRVDDALKGLGAAGKVFPIARARWWLLWGIYYEQSGRTRRAARAFARAASEAERWNVQWLLPMIAAKRPVLVELGKR